MTMLTLQTLTDVELDQSAADSRALLDLGCELADGPIAPDQTPRFFRAMAGLWALWLAHCAEVERRAAQDRAVGE